MVASSTHLVVHNHEEFAFAHEDEHEHGHGYGHEHETERDSGADCVVCACATIGVAKLLLGPTACASPLAVWLKAARPDRSAVSLVGVIETNPARGPPLSISFSR